jgi:hypothetical protein
MNTERKVDRRRPQRSIDFALPPPLIDGRHHSRTVSVGGLARLEQLDVDTDWKEVYGTGEEPLELR